jgi:hypothetical protein
MPHSVPDPESVEDSGDGYQESLKRLQIPEDFTVPMI